MTTSPIADNEAIYDTQINPLMAQIITLCTEHNIPFVFTFQLTPGTDDEDGPLYCSSARVPSNAAPLIKRAYDAIHQETFTLLMTVGTPKDKP